MELRGLFQPRNNDLENPEPEKKDTEGLQITQEDTKAIVEPTPAPKQPPPPRPTSRFRDPRPDLTKNKSDALLWANTLIYAAIDGKETYNTFYSLRREGATLEWNGPKVRLLVSMLFKENGGPWDAEELKQNVLLPMKDKVSAVLAKVGQAYISTGSRDHLRKPIDQSGKIKEALGNIIHTVEDPNVITREERELLDEAVELRNERGGESVAV